MQAAIVRTISTLVIVAASAAFGSASPLNSTILSLVPPGAEVVAGFENHPDANTSGRLLLTTHNNHLDLNDWQSLTGVDSNRVFNEVIEASASDAAGNLTEHLLLVAGRLDRNRIFASLEENGAKSTDFQGQRIMVIEPLARERGDMLEDRWFVVLENRIGILGTSVMVRHALERYADHAVPDPVLEERLSLLRRDVTSWNVLARAPKVENSFSFSQPHSAWAELQQDTDLLMVGVRFGSKIRIDFSVHSRADRNADFFTRKAAFFTDTMIAGPDRSPIVPAASDRRAEKFLVDADHVQGSVELSKEKFVAWCEQFSRRSVMPPAPSEAAGN